MKLKISSLLEPPSPAAGHHLNIDLQADIASLNNITE